MTNVPEIRFKGFTDDWEQRRLGDVAEFSKGSGYSKGDLIPKGSPIILYGRLYTKYETEIYDVDTFVDMRENSVLSRGGEVIVPSSGETAKDISRASVVTKAGVILGGDLNIVRPHDIIHSAFLAVTISNGNQQKELSRRAQGKSVVHISNSDLKDVNLQLPCLEEQSRIGTFFRNLDDIITASQRQVTLLKQLKAAYLQQMFPQAGEVVPRVRFEGFVEEWNKQKLEFYFYERSKRSGRGELISVTINSGVVKASELDRQIISSEDKSNYKIVRTGDIAYNSMRMWQGASGYSAYDGILSPAYTVITPKETAHSTFFAYLFKKLEMIQIFQRSSQGLTSDTWNLKFPALSQIEVVTPSICEQKAIANFFELLDSEINANSQRIMQLQKLKSAYLQKMFV